MKKNFIKLIQFIFLLTMIVKVVVYVYLEDNLINNITDSTFKDY